MKDIKFPNYLDKDATAVARLLLGAYLVREIDGQIVRVKIVETESYDQTDAASHSYKGKTARTETMFGSSGHAYVYFTYGMHYCLNVVTGEKDYGSGVLIRAVEPVENIELLEKRRGKIGVQVTNGPAKLCYALGVDLKLKGHDLRKMPLKLEAGDRIPDNQIVVATRIGISKEKEALRRFYIRDNNYVSVK